MAVKGHGGIRGISGTVFTAGLSMATRLAKALKPSKVPRSFGTMFCRILILWAGVVHTSAVSPLCFGSASVLLPCLTPQHYCGN